MEGNHPILKSPDHPISWLWNGTRLEPGDSIPLTDRGFRYGMSLFESFPVRNRLPVFLREHLDRLAQSCAHCGFQVETAALDSVKELFREAAADGFARIYVTAGDGPVSAPAEHCRVFVFIEPRPPVALEIYARGYHLAISPETHRPLFGGLKTANYWANLDALNRVRPNDEALLFNETGELISACMANAFIVTDGKIKTPSLKSGARAGIIRDWVMKHRPVEECMISRDDLKGADEIFLTSSWIGIMPAASLEGRAVAGRSIANALHMEYECAPV